MPEIVNANAQCARIDCQQGPKIDAIQSDVAEVRNFLLGTLTQAGFVRLVTTLDAGVRELKEAVDSLKQQSAAMDKRLAIVESRKPEAAAQDVADIQLGPFKGKFSGRSALLIIIVVIAIVGAALLVAHIGGKL